MLRTLCGLRTVCVLLALVTFWNAGAVAANPARPNLIVIMADDFGYECVRANGGSSYQTPNLDRLAERGVRFDRFYAQPLCTPTRVQLMTGQYNIRNYTSFGALDESQTTFANVLKQAGYTTGIVGKWQLGQGPKLPQKFGFDEALLWQHTRRPPRYANPGLELNGQEKDYTAGEYGPDLINAHALDFVTRHKDRPFFLYYPMILTHSPYQPTPDSAAWNPKAMGEKEGADKKHFGEMVAYADKMVGKLVAKLDELKLRDNTLIIFLGDNGSSGVTSTLNGKPFAGGKGKATDAGMHVPLIVSWPATGVAGKTCSDLADTTDILPTLCAAAGVTAPADLQLDGRSFVPQLRGEKGTPREWIYCWYNRNGGAKAESEFAMDQRYKLYRDGQLFDIAADALEKTPLTGQLTDEATAARGKLEQALARYKDARPQRLRKAAAKGAVNE